MRPSLDFVVNFLTFSEAEHMRDRVNALPADIEHLIGRLGKKAKDMDKDNGSLAKAKEKMLEGLLDNM